MMAAESVTVTVMGNMELIEWHNAAVHVPPAHRRLMVHTPNDPVPVSFGCYDDKRRCWYGPAGPHQVYVNLVTEWAAVPEGVLQE